MRRYLSAVAVALVLGLLAACTPAEPRAIEPKPAPSPKSGPSSEQLAALVQVDTSVKATGPSVHELITIDDIKKILGRDDIVIAEAT